MPTLRKLNRTTGGAVVLGLLVILVAAPLAAVLVTAFTGYQGGPSAVGTLVDPAMAETVSHTVVLSVLVVVFATVMAAPAAFVMSWTDIRRHQFIDVVIMVPFMTPPFIAALAWMDITRRGGVAEMLLGKTFGAMIHGLIYSVWGMALIMACELFPFLYLLLRNHFDRIPASFDEMAAVAGATPVKRFTRILLPLAVAPYSLGALIVFIRAAGEFGTPVTLGNAIGYRVLVSSIYEDITIAPLDFAGAAAGSTVLFAVGMTVWGIQQFFTRRQHTSGGRISRRTTITLSVWWRALAWLHLIIVALISVIVPYVSIILGATTILRSKPPTLNNLTIDYFGLVLADPTARRALASSATLAAIGATTGVIIALAVTVLVMRTPTRLGRINDFFALAPETVPAIVLAIGLIFFWNSPLLPATPYNTAAMLVIAYTVLFLPMITQNIKTSAASVSQTLIDAAAVSGAGRIRTFFRITLPMLAPGMAAGWLLAFLVGIREVVMSSLVRPSNMVLLSPWILNQFDQGNRAQAMTMTLIGVVSSTAVLVAVDVWRRRRETGRKPSPATKNKATPDKPTPPPPHKPPAAAPAHLTPALAVAGNTQGKRQHT